MYVSILYTSDSNPDISVNRPFSNDIGIWTTVTDQMREYFCRQAAFDCQHHNDLSASGKIFQGEINVIVIKACSFTINVIVKKSNGIGSVIHHPQVNFIASYVNYSHHQTNYQFLHLVATQIGNML